MSKLYDDIKEITLAIKESVIDSTKSITTFIVDGWLVLLFLLIVGGVGIALSNPPPPKHVKLAVGTAGFMINFSDKYKKFFKENGIDLEIVETKGLAANSELILDNNSDISAAFVLASDKNITTKSPVSSLGSVGYAPLWAIYDKSLPEGLKGLKGQRVLTGEKGTGSFEIATQILYADGVTDPSEIVEINYKDSFKAINDPNNKYIFLIEQPEDPLIQELSKIPRWQVSSWVRIKALMKKYPFLHSLPVPEGSINLHTNFPDQDLNILATTVDIVVKDNLNPSIQMLFLEASKKIGRKETFFSKPGEFPKYINFNIKESPEATMFYKNGQPKLMEYLPFWLATLIGRFKFFLFPFLVFSIPILKSIPNLKHKRSKIRIAKGYVELKSIDNDFTKDSTSNPNCPVYPYISRLDDLEKSLKDFNISSKNISDYYSLLGSISTLRDLINQNKNLDSQQ